MLLQNTAKSTTQTHKSLQLSQFNEQQKLKQKTDQPEKESVVAVCWVPAIYCNKCVWSARVTWCYLWLADWLTDLWNKWVWNLEWEMTEIEVDKNKNDELACVKWSECEADWLRWGWRNSKILRCYLLYTYSQRIQGTDTDKSTTNFSPSSSTNMTAVVQSGFNSWMWALNRWPSCPSMVTYRHLQICTISTFTH